MVYKKEKSDWSWKIRRSARDRDFWKASEGQIMSNSASTNATRASLLGRAVERDEAAWRQLVELYGPLVAYSCRGFHLDSHAVADVVQEVFLSVFNSIGRFRSPPGTGAFRSWLWRITRNKLIDGRRRNHGFHAEGGSSIQKRLASVHDPNSISADEPTDNCAIEALTHRALHQIELEFHSQTWTAFWRTAIDGIASAIVASELGITAAGVRQARSRVMRRLREQLDE